MLQGYNNLYLSSKGWGLRQGNEGKPRPGAGHKLHHKFCSQAVFMLYKITVSLKLLLFFFFFLNNGMVI